MNERCGWLPRLTEHGCPIAPTTYCAALARGRIPSARERRDEMLKVEISRVDGENYRVYGARTAWLQLNREGDLVERNFNPPAPNKAWVAGFTYVPTWSGMVYVAFVFDAYSRRILRWRAATTMKTTLVLDALEQSVWTRHRAGIVEFDGLIHHNYAGSQFFAPMIAQVERVLEVRVVYLAVRQADRS